VYLTEDEKKAQLGKAATEYEAVLAAAGRNDGLAIHAVSALFGLASVAESRGELDKAKEQYTKLIELANRVGYTREAEADTKGVEVSVGVKVDGVDHVTRGIALEFDAEASGDPVGQRRAAAEMDFRVRELREVVRVGVAVHALLVAREAELLRVVAADADRNGGNLGLRGRGLGHAPQPGRDQRGRSKKLIHERSFLD
jgi:hypothetical protein